MTPSIIFDLTDDIAWESYNSLINYIEAEENKDYLDYHRMIDSINNIIDNFNSFREKTLETIPENDSFDDSRNKKGKDSDRKGGVQNARDSGLRSIISKRIKAFDEIIEQCKTSIIKSVIKYTETNEVSICEIELTPIHLKHLAEIYNEDDKKALQRDYPKLRVTQVHIDMLDIYIKYHQCENNEYNENIFGLQELKGSYYRFVKSTCSIDLLKAMKEPKSDQDKWKIRNRMISLAESQKIDPSDIDGIIDVIIRGLEFGITIINPSLPFVIQHIILDNLRTKNLGIVFASTSMTMGINYALRSVVIKSPPPSDRRSINSTQGVYINPSNLIQMGGRCGRRGLDNQAHVIYWGIINDIDASSEYIPALTRESFIINNIKSLTLISNCNDLAIELIKISHFNFFEDEKVKDDESKKIDKNKKNGGQKKEYHNNYEHHKKETVDDDEERLRKELDKRNKAQKVKHEKSEYIKPSIEALSRYIELQDINISELIEMICRIDRGEMMEDYKLDSFHKSRKINILLRGLIEVHNSFSLTKSVEFLKFIKSLVNILQVCEYKLIKISN
jgi:hypothetical protein